MIKDSGERTQFDTGAVRDMHTGKGRMDLLPWEALDVPGQDIGHGKGQQVDGDQRDKGEQRRVPEGVQERGVLKRLFVVVEPHPGPTAGDLEFAEGQEQPVAEGPQEPDAEGGEGGQQEQPDPALDGAADQAGVEGARHPLLEQGAHIDHSP